MNETPQVVLLRLIKQSGLIPYKVAQLLGVNPGLVYRVMHGGHSPSVMKAMKQLGYLPANRKRFAAWLYTTDKERAESVRQSFDAVARALGYKRAELVEAIADGAVSVLSEEEHTRLLREYHERR